VDDVRTSDFDYHLPEDLIAQQPTPERGGSRLLVLERSAGRIDHRRFADFPAFLQRGDVLVLNNSRVVPARLRGVNAITGGRFELLLLEENAKNDWWVMVKPGKRARTGTRIVLEDRAGRATTHSARVVDVNDEGHRRVMFEGVPDLWTILEELGETPLPPYINRAKGPGREDRERYQTIYANAPGSVAAPTAGLHFTRELLARVEAAGAVICHVTLHVGLGTFAPVKCDNIADHPMHEERFSVPEATAAEIAEARRRGNRVFAVGTTSLRVLEAVAATHDGRVVSGAGRTRIFIYPPYRFRAVDALLTNFHLPRSTLLMLVSAFAEPGGVSGRELALRAYAEAIREHYRFFSYGDAMLLV